MWPTPTFFLDLTVPKILCYAFVSSMPTSLVGLNKTFLKKNLTLNSKKKWVFLKSHCKQFLSMQNLPFSINME